MQGHLVHTSSLAEYDLGGEGDLFKAPEPIIEEPLLGMDPMTTAIPMISCTEDGITSQGLKAADIVSFQNEQLLREVFYECEKELLVNSAIETPLSEVLDTNVPVARTMEDQIQKSKVLSDVPFQKSVSSGCLSSMEWLHGSGARPNFLDFPGIDFSAAYGMRRAFSDGDIKVSLDDLFTVYISLLV